MQEPAEDLISLPIAMNDKISDTKFRLVHVASQRVRQLSAGAPLEVSTHSIKDTTVALEEAVAGKFKIIVGEAAIEAREEFHKREARAKAEAELSAKEEEIRRELSAYLSESSDEEGSADEVAEEGLGEENTDATAEEAEDSDK